MASTIHLTSCMLLLLYIPISAQAEGVGIHQGRDENGRVICNLENYPTRHEMEVLTNVAGTYLDMSNDRQWRILRITEKVWQHWGWRDDYKSARSKYIDATGSVINYRQVDAAVGIVAKIACNRAW